MSSIHPSCAVIAKVRFRDKEIISVLHRSNNECGIAIDHDINNTRSIYKLLERWFDRGITWSILPFKEIMGLEASPSWKKMVKDKSSINYNDDELMLHLWKKHCS
jgi:hypothetical protein